MKKCAVLLVGLLSGCVGSDTIKTSAATAIIQTRAAPVCGSSGAARTAQRHAAIETIKSGYDRYIIYDAQASNNVRTSQMPGTYRTTGNFYGNNVMTTTTYTPGPTIVSGSHRQSFAIKMFRDGDPGAGNAISARQMLGPDWEKAVEAGPLGVCLN